MSSIIVINIFYIGCVVLLLAVISYFYYKNFLLSKDNTYFQGVMDNLPTIVYLKDVSGRILKVNDTLAKMLQCPKKDIEGTISSESFLAYYMDIINEEDKYITTTHNSIYVDRYIELVKGEPHWYNIMKSPVYDKKKRLIGIFVRFQNIDSLKNIEEQKECFVATLTHDLKSPASSQLNAINMLLNGHFGKLSQQQQEMIELLRCSCQYMSKLIATIIDTYIYDNGKIKLSYENFDLSLLVGRLKKGLHETLIDKELVFTIKNELSDNFITADRLQLKRVIMNFITNAITYSSNNSKIEIQMKSDNGILEFNVINTSKFTQSENLENAFEKFKTLKNSKYNKASTGLGLYISKQIIELHNGEIYAKFLQDNKCLFGFKIPVKQHILLEKQPCS